MTKGWIFYGISGNAGENETSNSVRTKGDGRRRSAALRGLIAGLLALGALAITVSVEAGAGDATGAPVIFGKPVVGETISAQTNNNRIRDRDGISTSTSFTYQWIREDPDGSNSADITSATGSTYTLTTADTGKKIKVKVSFNDNRGNAEELTSIQYPQQGLNILPTSRTATTCAEPSLTGRTLGGTATLTVGAYAINNDVKYGWFTRSSGTISVGDVPQAQRTFKIHTDANVVRVVSVELTVTNGSTTPRLDIVLARTLTADERATLQVHVCDRTFNFSDAGVTVTSTVTRYSWSRLTNYDWATHPTRTLRWSYAPPPNNDPVFTDTTLTRSIAENTAANTNVGAVIPAATDADSSDTLTYTMEGTDAGSFTFDAATRQIKTKTGVTYNFETKASYSVTIKVDDNNGGTDTVAVTISLTDVAEKPAKPAALMVEATSGSTTSLDVSWTAPGLNGGPAITGYEVQYREGTTGAYTAHAHSGTGTSATIPNLMAGTSHQVQVRALNGETPSDWSEPVPGSTNTPGNNAPVFTDTTLTRSIAENAAANTNVGAVIPAATDADNNDTLTYTMDGPDAGSFTFDASTRQITTKSGITYDHEAKASYSVTVKVDDNNGGTDTVAVTITVTDVAEPPTAPAAPGVQATSGSTTSLDVSWTAPANAGKPAISSYDLQYRAGASGTFTAGPEDVTGTSAAITNLLLDTEYQVQVRATNADGDGDWSAPGMGRTAETPSNLGPPPLVNTAPSFLDAAAERSVPENTAADAAVGDPVSATDPEGDALIYTLEGTDAASFTIDDSTGQIRTKEGVDYDHETKATYSVTVRADDGGGGTAGIAVTIAVNDVAEQPARPAAPLVVAMANNLEVSWPKPDLNGGPEITGYDLQYRVGNSGSFTNGPQDVTGTSAAITNLLADTFYQVRVRARNGETPSEWSAPGTTAERLDPLARAWLSRFGRTVATHVTDAVGERLRAAPGQDSHVTVGGYRLPLGRHAAGGADPEPTEPESTTDRLTSLLTGLVGRALGLGLAPPQGGDGTDPSVDQPEPDPRLGQSQTLQLPTVRLRDVLVGSSFRLALGDDAAAPGSMRLTAWGRVAGTQYDGRDGDLTLDGNVLTGTVGMDSAWDRWLAGVAVSHSLGGGSFSTRAGGNDDLDSSTLTSLHPYLRYAVNERVEVWSVLGYGWGDMTLEPGTGGTLETDTTLLMGSFGGRGILLSATDNAGYQLATRTDAMLTRTTSGAVAGLAATDAEAHRLRLVLEGTRDVTWPEGQRVTPTVELGVRHDWGDAETGFGLELGGRVQYVDPGHGLTLEAAVRGLLAHEDSDYQEWGASGSLRIDPGPTGQGFSLTLAPTWGAASSGIESLWSRQTTAGLAPQGNRSTPVSQMNAEVGYGLWVPSIGGLVRPFTAVTVAGQGGSRSRVGLVVDRPGTWGTGLRVELAGERIATAGGPPEQTIGLQLQFLFGSSGKGPAVGRDNRGRKSRATRGRASSALETVAAVPQTSEPTRADNGRRRAAVRHHAAAMSPMQKTPPASALDRAGGRRYVVQLGAFSNHANAIKAKTELAVDLSDIHRHTTRPLTIVASKKDDLLHVVIAQAFRTPEAAATLCAGIKGRGLDCSIMAAWPIPDKASRGLHVVKIRGCG